jgi:hypothetical protein
MKKIFLLIFLITLGIRSYPDYVITRGPNPGEIYFIGLTNTGVGIYYSTDYGATATCQDYESYFYGSICADKTEGILYLGDFFGALYISTNYGITGSWEYRNSGMYSGICGSRIEGELYNIFVAHSEDFGQTFISHAYNGFFGNYFESEIDNQTNIGYVLTYKSNVADSVYLLKSVDNYENLYLNEKFVFNWNDAIELSRGTNNGELFLFNHSHGLLLLSIDFGNTWISLNNFNYGEFYSLGIVGGRIEGEVYIKCDFLSMSWQNANTYILHSLDYGITYEVSNIFSKGQEPLLANFSAKNSENENITFTNYDSVYIVTGEMPLDVQFYNYSIGDIGIFEWDFNNDGIIDSYEINPAFTYQDTGWYSVNLIVYNNIDTNSFLRENYIHVIKTVGYDEATLPEISCYPNPFKNKITFEHINYPFESKILIFNISGNVIRKLSVFPNVSKAIWDGTDDNGIRCKPGIYYVKLDNKEFPQKILLIN